MKRNTSMPSKTKAQKPCISSDPLAVAEYVDPAWKKKWEGVIEDAQTQTHYRAGRKTYPRIVWEGPGECGDCGAAPGQFHAVGNHVTPGSPPVGSPLCDMERCPRCGLQAIGCYCGLRKAVRGMQ